jgi:hypothetical protein
MKIDIYCDETLPDLFTSSNQSDKNLLIGSLWIESELREDILNEIAGEGKRIIDEKEIKILKENTEIMQLWMKNNPKKAEDFLRFKEGFEASKKSR